MKRINREHQRVSENNEAVKGFETCKRLRRQVLSYLQHIESGDLLGGLLHANDELIEALMAFEILDKSLQDDSDSEDDQVEAPSSKTKQTPYGQMAGLNLREGRSLASPTKPTFIPLPPSNSRAAEEDRDVEEEEEEQDDDDENDPFADRNAIDTQKVERNGMTW